MMETLHRQGWDIIAGWTRASWYAVSPRRELWRTPPRKSTLSGRYVSGCMDAYDPSFARERRYEPRDIPARGSMSSTTCTLWKDVSSETEVSFRSRSRRRYRSIPIS